MKVIRFVLSRLGRTRRVPIFSDLARSLARYTAQSIRPFLYYFLQLWQSSGQTPSSGQSQMAAAWSGKLALVTTMLAPFLLYYEEAYCSYDVARYDELAKNGIFSNMASAGSGLYPFGIIFTSSGQAPASGLKPQHPPSRPVHHTFLFYKKLI